MTVTKTFVRILILAMGSSPCATIALANDNSSETPTPEENVIWVGGFSSAEKETILRQLLNNTHGIIIKLDSTSRIFKDDLNMDDDPDYIINGFTPNFQDHEHRDVLLLLQSEKKGFRRLLHIPSNSDTGISRFREIYTIDFDGDSLKDIVDQRQYHIGGEEEAQSYCLVLHNDGNRLTPVYSATSYNAVDLEDLNGDGTLELIEWTNEFRLWIAGDALWPVIFEWNGEKYREASASYTAYYIGLTDRYESVLNEATQHNNDFEEKTGKPNPVYQAVMRAMKIYLDRIKAMRDESNQ